MTFPTPVQLLQLSYIVAGRLRPISKSSTSLQWNSLQMESQVADSQVVDLQIVGELVKQGVPRQLMNLCLHGSSLEGKAF